SNSYTCDSKVGGNVLLPPYGFLAEAPTFIAFHASNWSGLDYQTPTLFTLRSLDNQPLSRSGEIRVFHAFGSDRIRLGNTTQSVTRETVCRPTSPKESSDSK